MINWSVRPKANASLALPLGDQYEYERLAEGFNAADPRPGSALPMIINGLSS
jgi:hypothetical protein